MEFSRCWWCHLVCRRDHVLNSYELIRTLLYGADRALNRTILLKLESDVLLSLFYYFVKLSLKVPIYRLSLCLGCFWRVISFMGWYFTLFFFLIGWLRNSVGSLLLFLYIQFISVELVLAISVYKLFWLAVSLCFELSCLFKSCITLSTFFTSMSFCSSFDF